MSYSKDQDAPPSVCEPPMPCATCIYRNYGAPACKDCSEHHKWIRMCIDGTLED